MSIAHRVAVLIPCHNEAAGVATVVEGFRKALPKARIVVCDNASADGTAEKAAEAGAEVIFERKPGKGNAMRRLWDSVEADVYIMVDGDGTYPAEAAPRLLEAFLEEGFDLLIAAREPVHESAHRAGHLLGNQLFSRLFSGLFGRDFVDIFSGYRVMTQAFIRSFPMQSTGFEIEMEMNVYAAVNTFKVGVVPVPFYERAAGSSSKLRTIRDGCRVFWTMLNLYWSNGYKTSQMESN